MDLPLANDIAKQVREVDSALEELKKMFRSTIKESRVSRRSADFGEVDALREERKFFEEKIAALDKVRGELLIKLRAARGK